MSQDRFSPSMAGCTCNEPNGCRSAARAQGGRPFMSNEEIYNKVKDLVSKHLNIDEKEVTKEASFIEDLGADSLDTVELIMSFEEEFNIEIPDEDAESIRTVQNVVDYIQEHVS
jgi:acyl carrier protein